MELVSRLQAAKILGVSNATLAAWAFNKTYVLPYTKIKRRVMYKLSDVKALLEHRKDTHMRANSVRKDKVKNYYYSGIHNRSVFDNGRDNGYSPEEFPEEDIRELRIGKINDDY